IPFYVTAAAKPGASVARLREVLETSLDSIARTGPSADEMERVRAGALGQAELPPMTWRALKAQGAMIAGQTGRDSRLGPGLALVQAAIDTARRDHVYGPDPMETARAVQKMTKQE